MCAHRRYKKERRRFLSAKIGRIQEKTPNGRKRTKKNARGGCSGVRKNDVFYVRTTLFITIIILFPIVITDILIRFIGCKCCH